MDAIGTRLGWPMDSGAPRFSVNGIVADFGAGELRDADGQLVRLRPQSLAVLRHLAANPGRLVGKGGFHTINWDVPKLEIGYWVRTSMAGQGLCTEAVTALVDFAQQIFGRDAAVIKKKLAGD